jgi:hypothetical protein
VSTLAWLFIFAGIVVIRSVSKGRGITDIPGDLGDLLTAALTNDPKALRAVLARGNADLATPVNIDPAAPSNGPFPTEDTYNLGTLVDPKLIVIANEVGRRHRISKIIGYRPFEGKYGDDAHSSGKAIDMFVTSKSAGDAIAADLLANASRYHITYVIWYQRIWYPSKGWTTMPDRGSANNNHMNHIHVNV